jgi:hypothetical protein
MKFISNVGTDRVADLVRPWLNRDHMLDMVSSSLSLFAFSELLEDLLSLDRVRIVIPPPVAMDGTDAPSSEDQLGLSEPVALYETEIELPDLLTELQDRTQLTRKTIAHKLNSAYINIV